MIRPLWIEVDLKALRSNFKAVKKHVGQKVKTIATIKQSAYGHGLIPVARELCACGADFFGVGSVEEAALLRKHGFKGSILVLSAVLDKFTDAFIEHNIIPTVVDLKFARRLNKAAAIKGLAAPVHVKIDTGMGRLGVCYAQAFSFIKQLSKLKNISLEGIYTHFPAADSDPEFTNFQIKAFNDFILKLKKENISFKYRHCANSIATADYPSAHFNMVRPGLILYGINPSESSGLKVKPCLSLKSRVIFVKRIDKGEGVSYARTYIAEKSRYVATIAAGYADGYPWSLSNRARVIIKDRLFDVIGRVCMDHVMIDLKDNSSIKPSQEVVLIGKSKNNHISAKQVAQWAGTIPYEIISRLSHNLPRVYKNAIS